MSKNYSMTDVGAYEQFGKAESRRVELRAIIGLTGSEISVNRMQPGAVSRFLHTHKLNEEVYLVISGSGQFRVDDDVFPIQEGSAVRVSPNGVRAIKAGDEGIVYLCIQAEQGSLTQASMDDGLIHEGEVFPS